MARLRHRLHAVVAVILTLPGNCWGSEGACRQTDEGVKCDSEEGYRLTRLDGGKVGDIKEVKLDGRTVTLKTLSLKPLLFEIPDFLTAEECDHFVSLAKSEGLENSQTTTGGGAAPPRFQILDSNGDKKLTVDEMRLTIENGFDIYPDNEDVLQFYADTQLDGNGDGVITPDEMEALTPDGMQKYLSDFVKKQPEKHSRFSNQVWLYPDKSSDAVFKTVQKRVSMVTELPVELVRMSDFQVVQYDVKGHYNAHYDSSRLSSTVPCCKRFDRKKCRICRYMTVLFYLNDVEEGGETAFLVADNETVHDNVMRESNQVNLYRRCADARLTVRPGKGKAVMWYNHFVKEENQWLGEQDDFGIHGGCAVVSGEKWIGNFWIKVTDDKEEDIKRMLKLKY
ncbi:transmembrane prolyl 4-hydroxylase-like [Haliotis rufescens]|uniref:transmembrane prolyl 4-hydroxylase-like n=1 Tax=Haliotis rufescens TaxID=6454 RepID=UPI00201FA045|nr:transmembrane prolyl 4-hydroxylase-like [Haliotis rufescens]